MKYAIVLFFVILIFVSCKNQVNTSEMNFLESIDIEVNTDTLTFLALGDSYTIGESVAIKDRWPNQLTRKFIDNEVIFSPPKIIAKTGWTTDELKEGIKKESLNNPYDLVSLLIGVNNQFRGYPVDQYIEEFEELLDSAIFYAGSKANNVFVVSIPDYGVTPFGSKYDTEKIADELDNYNYLAKGISNKKNVTFIDITEDSRRAKNDSALIATDNLHPSGKMYSSWVEIIYPLIKEKID